MFRAVGIRERWTELRGRRNHMRAESLLQLRCAVLDVSCRPGPLEGRSESTMNPSVCCLVFPDELNAAAPGVGGVCPPLNGPPRPGCQMRWPYSVRHGPPVDLPASPIPSPVRLTSPPVRSAQISRCERDKRRDDQLKARKGTSLDAVQPTLACWLPRTSDFSQRPVPAMRPDPSRGASSCNCNCNCAEVSQR